MLLKKWLLLSSQICAASTQVTDSGNVPSDVNQTSTSLTNLTLPITPANRPRRSGLTITTSADNPRKIFPAGALLWTYLEIINTIYEGEDTRISSERPWVRGCIFGFQCTYYHVNETDHPPDATIAWGMIGIINEQFRINTATPASSRWMVESWRFTVNGFYVTEITNNFWSLATDNAPLSLSSGALEAKNGTSVSCKRKKKNVLTSRYDILPPTWLNSLQWNGARIPLRSILALFFDLFIRFFFRYEKTTRIDQAFGSGYTWTSGRDPQSGAFMKLEIINAIAPKRYSATPIPIGDLYEAVHCWLFPTWIGDYADEEEHQKGFVASFRLWESEEDYARLTLDLASPKEALADLDQNIWTGGSWLDAPGVSSIGNGSTIAEIAAAK